MVVSHKALRQTPPEQTPPSPRTRHTTPADQAHLTPPCQVRLASLDQAPPREADLLQTGYKSGRYQSICTGTHSCFTNHYETLMHSSGMCTACLLAVSQHALHSWFCVITVCTGHGGCLSKDMHWVEPSISLGGVCLGVSAWGVSTIWSQVTVYQQAMGQSSPSVDMTDSLQIFVREVRRTSGFKDL